MIPMVKRESSFCRKCEWPLFNLGCETIRFVIDDATSLGGLAIVGLDDPAELALASNSVFGFRNEGFVQYRVVPTDPAMWPLLMIMFEPHTKNSIESPVEKLHCLPALLPIRLHDLGNQSTVDQFFSKTHS